MRRVWRKGGNKEKVFGCDLLEHLNASSQEIPQVLRSCSEFVETNGIVDGIYRLSGVSSNIQKLRGEFENDGSPDLNKDLYLQDIHCISSLCKAYFRELPNPLLTYQLYDKFAEAVAIQLEEERLVKIRDVLKELPGPHYRTLEFLMRHLVKMASYSSETNMHARNLAIVWAPNLLRSKDIEASGFNGRAAFREVRVQSIVVEFILTHVPQLFPEEGVSQERRKSLPSPSAASCQEGFFKATSTQPFPNFGNISPGDGPLPIRPYHAIIEGTDKRKGSLKGRKWMSIFNIGGRFHDPRRRHKHSTKEKERPALRPARSMDSLSTPSYPNEGSRHTAQRPPSTNITTTPPIVTPSLHPGSDVTVCIGGSEYAVTYRRGTGLVSGGAGTQGTYTSLDPEGFTVTGNETLQSRSPGLSTKIGRRAAMHISGPTMVTVPLHITSNLALGVLQGGGSDRVIHRGRDKDGGDRVEGKEGGEKAERRESRAIERKIENYRKQEEEEEEKDHGGKETDREEVVAGGENAAGGGDRKESGGGEMEDKEEVKVDCGWKPELVVGSQSVSREQRVKSLTSNSEEGHDEDDVNDDKDDTENDEYMDMKGVNLADGQPEVTQCEDVRVFEASDILNSTELEGDDLGLSGYVQDNFDFLDQMDCSILDHMDCSVPHQVSEFSVEPPGHSDDEYEVMEQAQPAEPHTHLQPHPEAQASSPTEPNPHRQLSIDTHSRHAKSLSLPYMTSPIHGPEESGSEEEVAEDDSEENSYSSEDDESMFVKSLPSDFFLNNFSGFEPDTDTQALDRVQICEGREGQSLNFESPECKEFAAGDREQVEVEEDDEDGLQEKEPTNKDKEDEVHQERDQLENIRQSSKATEEDFSVVEDPRGDEEHPHTSEAWTDCCTDHPLPSKDESSTMVDTLVKDEKEKEVDDNPLSDCPPFHTFSSFEESRDSSVSGTEQPITCAREDAEERDCEEEEDSKVCNENQDICQEIVLEIEENDESTWEETSEEGNKVIADIKLEGKVQEGGKEQDVMICGTSGDIKDEYEDVRYEVTEEEARRQVLMMVGRESVVREEDKTGHIKTGQEEEEQIEKVSQEKTLDADEGGTNETEVGTGIVKESMEINEDKLTDREVQHELKENEVNEPKKSQLDEAVEEKHSDKAQYDDKEEEVSEQKENNDKERADEQPRTQPSVDPVRSDVKESKKCEESDGNLGGVGRKLVISKHPKVYQVKAVPVVPPKPQHCKITALTLRQQQQQRERRDADKGREKTEQDAACAGDRGKDGDEGGGKKEKPTHRGGEKEWERRRDGDEMTMKDTSRNSPLSMCFDEAVAIATMRREKEKGCEKERQREWGNEVQ